MSISCPDGCTSVPLVPIQRRHCSSGEQKNNRHIPSFPWGHYSNTEEAADGGGLEFTTGRIRTPTYISKVSQTEQIWIFQTKSEFLLSALHHQFTIQPLGAFSLSVAGSFGFGWMPEYL